MNPVGISVQAARDLYETLSNVDPAQVESLSQAITKAKCVFLAGAGRSMLMLRGFAMRLMHAGLTVYVVGDTTTPAFQKDDLLIIGSGSGETGGLIGIANKVKKLGGTLAVMTIFKDSTLGKKADVLVRIPAYTDKLPESEENKRCTLPGGSLFEQSILLLGDSIIVPIAQQLGTPTDRAFERHANLE